MPEPSSHHTFRPAGRAAGGRARLAMALLLALLAHAALLTLPAPQPMALATEETALQLLQARTPAKLQQRQQVQGPRSQPPRRPGTVPASVTHAGPAAAPAGTPAAAMISPAQSDNTESLPTPTAPELPVAATTTAVSTETALTAPDYQAAYLKNPKPDYPEQAVRLKLEGTTVLRVEVNRDGLPQTIQLLSSSGTRLLDQAAEKAVARYRFIPAQRGKNAVVAWVQVPIVWRLPLED